MKNILIIGAGAMGSAFSVPCVENNNNVSLIGTHLEDSLIETIKSKNNFHSKLNVSLPSKLKVEKIDVIITTGGTGLTGRDITPEAIDEIADKKIPGFGEIFRYISLSTVGTSSIQSRACAVLANGKYVFALPGSSGGVKDAWDKILVHQLNIKHKPCNFVELFPRLKEK